MHGRGAGWSIAPLPVEETQASRGARPLRQGKQRVCFYFPSCPGDLTLQSLLLRRQEGYRTKTHLQLAVSSRNPRAQLSGMYRSVGNRVTPVSGTQEYGFKRNVSRGVLANTEQPAPWGQKLFPALKHHTVQESATLPPREERHSVTHLWTGAEWRGAWPCPVGQSSEQGCEPWGCGFGACCYSGLFSSFLGGIRD